MRLAVRLLVLAIMIFWRQALTARIDLILTRRILSGPETTIAPSSKTRIDGVGQQPRGVLKLETNHYISVPRLLCRCGKTIGL